jgi:hypothetical protein
MPVKQDKSGFQVSWTTVTYRSVLLAIVVILALIGFVLYLLFPQPMRELATKVTDALSGAQRAGVTTKAGQQSASFTMIDGTVRVKKANSNTWVNADYTTQLEKGDVVQTSSQGIAKVVFADHTYYTVKQDSLIVIEENSTNTAQQTNVAVELTSGTVDLSTGTYPQGSRSQVILAGARASFSPDSTAMVRNDPRADKHEVLLRKGGGELVRGNDRVALGEYERASFRQDQPGISKQKELAPPTLIAPANMLPIFVLPKESASVDFSWSPVDSARLYHVRVSRNPYFSSTVFDRTTPVPSIKLPGLSEGAYYWTVQAIDANNRESVESEKNRFTLIAKTAEASLPLELQPFVQHGRTIEIRGKTEPGARVMVNGAEVPVVGADGSFFYFVPPLGDGENVITVTAQNAKGGVNTVQKKVVIQ